MKLKPCLRCGNENVEVKFVKDEDDPAMSFHQVQCGGCGYGGDCHLGGESDAAEAWNDECERDEKWAVPYERKNNMKKTHWSDHVGFLMTPHGAYVRDAEWYKLKEEFDKLNTVPSGRKIMQCWFESWSEEVRGDTYEYRGAFALCDDGTIWVWDYDEKEWQHSQRSQIPQGPIE